MVGSECCGLRWHIPVGREKSVPTAGRCQPGLMQGSTGVETLARIPNAHAEGSIVHFCTVHDKIYLYIYLPSTFYLCKEKRVFIPHSGEVCIHCANNPSVAMPVS